MIAAMNTISDDWVPVKILGPHPEPDAFGCHTQAEDATTNSDVPHRALSQDSDWRWCD